VLVEARKSAGTWRYEALEFAFGSGAVVNLLDASLPQLPGKPSLMPPDSTPPKSPDKSDDGST
jgi:hypothetical protein